ncbi:hypothetical protein FSP39_024319 [Pinctada imbricata]|uniref:Uncharacterized protein n=1 Tax=Pinctada imbricata TaxID=66713 RepID=A0AA89BXL4_PINIB|nr:hypothetical protein FSP39_024319 [Pinctada imbricata]
MEDTDSGLPNVSELIQDADTSTNAGIRECRQVLVPSSALKATGKKPSPQWILSVTSVIFFFPLGILAVRSSIRTQRALSIGDNVIATESSKDILPFVASSYIIGFLIADCCYSDLFYGKVQCLIHSELRLRTYFNLRRTFNLVDADSQMLSICFDHLPSELKVTPK